MENLLSTLDEGHKREQVHKILGELLINMSNQYFENREIYIDGYRFINCYFKNVRMIALRGTFEFHNCRIAGSFRVFSEEAQKSIQLMTLALRK